MTKRSTKIVTYVTNAYHAIIDGHHIEVPLSAYYAWVAARHWADADRFRRLAAGAQAALAREDWTNSTITAVEAAKIAENAALRAAAGSDQRGVSDRPHTDYTYKHFEQWWASEPRGKAKRPEDEYKYAWVKQTAREAWCAAREKKR